MMTGRQAVSRAIRFQTPDRLPRDLPGRWGSDFAFGGMNPSPDGRPQGGKGIDEWGAVWDNIGVCQVGEVRESPLKDWSDFPKLRIPDVSDPARWSQIHQARQDAGEKFLLGSGISLYERVHFLRGLENTWSDIYEEPQRLTELIDILTEMNLKTVEGLSAAGFDGIIWPDDWGLQDRLMISPAKWREIWKPHYARIYQAAHARGLFTFLHSCGHIVDILDDLIEAGLDVIHMDQQQNMGLELLGRRFSGRLTFFSPVDIQMAMHGSLPEVRAYARRMADNLARPEGGFIPRWYTDPRGAGHSDAAIDAMCDEFMRISDRMYGRVAI